MLSFLLGYVINTKDISEHGKSMTQKSMSSRKVGIEDKESENG